VIQDEDNYSRFLDRDDWYERDRQAHAIRGTRKSLTLFDGIAEVVTNAEYFTGLGLWPRWSPSSSLNSPHDIPQNYLSRVSTKQ
jgi:hypothetical protein